MSSREPTPVRTSLGGKSLRPSRKKFCGCCGLEIRTSNDGLKCAICEQRTHVLCVEYKFTEVELTKFRSKNTPHHFHCQKCIDNEHKKDKGINLHPADELEKEMLANLAIELSLKDKMGNDLNEQLVKKEDELAKKTSPIV